MKRKSLLFILLIIITVVTYKLVNKYSIVRYKVDSCYIPIKDGDYNKAEKFVGSIINYKKHPTDENKNILDSLSTYFEFSNMISLINIEEKWGNSKHMFSDEYTIIETNDNQIKFNFDSIDYKVGLPVICASSIIPVKPYKSYKVNRSIDRKLLTKETKFWPVNHPTIKSISKRICKNKTSEEEKVISILEWMNNNFKWGKEKGTRFGPIKFIEQGFGRCADFSDLFITLCRTSGIPARQVIGYVYKKGGHSWCQVYFDKKGWESINPPNKKLGVNNSFIPFSISETGNLTFLYYSIPRIEKIN